MSPPRTPADFMPPKPRGHARVHIYGGGISGLTAAHELAIRGFRVRVIEPAREYTEKGSYEGQPRLMDSLALGGLARSQFLRVDKGATGNFPEQGQLAASDDYRFFYEYSPDFVPTPEEPYYRYFGLDDRMYHFRLGTGLNRAATAPGVLFIRIPPSPSHERRSRRSDNARAMQGYFTGTVLGPDRVFVVRDEDERFAAQQGTPLPALDDKEGLLLEMQHFLPGEHGFRFFPSYYRHLFSTMVEIPILDESGGFTDRRVFDHLVPSSFYGIAAQGRRIRFVRRAPPSRPVELLQELSDLATSGYPPSDALQFTLRLWRYMCTSSERRKADFEGITWWEYLEGHDARTDPRRYQYSAAFKKDMQFAPRVLAAFDGAWGDARTNGNTLVQLYLNNLLPLPKTDGTLSGPTTPAWFRPWRRYLEEYLGVEFIRGRLSRLVVQEDRIIPWWKRWDELFDSPDTEVRLSDFHSEHVDYFIVATDAVTAESVTEGLPEIGVVQGLRGYTTWIPPNPRGREPRQPRPKEWVLPGREPWDRFQTLTGIQFFFPSTVRLAEGYLYFLDAPWGLSAINSHQYWATPPTLEQDGFASVLSVDIGNWYVTEPGLKSPSRSSRQELAHEVWSQIRKATEQHNAPLPYARQSGFTLPEPGWYHVDRFIQFQRHPETGRERPYQNHAPYLIPIVGDWDHRPGPEPWDPIAPAAPRKPRPPLPRGLWQAPHGGYYVHWDKLVFAGTYLKTFTRMTTMESANESARHAVNAILDHYLAHHPLPLALQQRGVAGPDAVPTISEYGSQGSTTGSPGFRMTPIGEYCRIWNPERYELPELAPLRELDARLFAAGLPHVWDLLGLEPLATGLDPLGGASALLALVRQAKGSVEALLQGAMPGSQ